MAKELILAQRNADGSKLLEKTLTPVEGEAVSFDSNGDPVTVPISLDTAAATQEQVDVGESDSTFVAPSTLRGYAGGQFAARPTALGCYQPLVKAPMSNLDGAGDISLYWQGIIPTTDHTSHLPLIKTADDSGPWFGIERRTNGDLWLKMQASSGNTRYRVVTDANVPTDQPVKIWATRSVDDDEAHLYIDGVEVATGSDQTEGTGADWSDTVDTDTLYSYAAGCITQHNSALNVVLSESDVQAFQKFGVAALAQYRQENGAGITSISDTQYNGDFETSGSGYANSPINGWYQTYSTTLTAAFETGDSHTGTQCLKVTGGGSMGGSQNNTIRAGNITTGQTLSGMEDGRAVRIRAWVKKVSGGNLQIGVGFEDLITVSSAADWTLVQWVGVLPDGDYQTLSIAAASSAVWLIDDIVVDTVGWCVDLDLTRNTGYQVMDQSGAGQHGLITNTSFRWLMPYEDLIVVPGRAMVADGFIPLEQVITPEGYELVAAYATQNGTETSTITVKETSSGGTTVATGALSASATKVSLTLSNTLLAAGKKLHLANSGWASNTVTPFFVFRRAV